MVMSHLVIKRFIVTDFLFVSLNPCKACATAASAMCVRFWDQHTFASKYMLSFLVQSFTNLFGPLAVRLI